MELLMDSAQPCQKLPQQEDFFCWESNSICINLDTKVDAIGRYCVQKSNAQEGEVCLVDGAPLKEREKGGASR